MTSQVSALDRIAANLLALRIWAQKGSPQPFIDEGHTFVVGEPMPEAEILEIEREYEVSLPADYRAFIQLFGDCNVGPGNQFRKVREGLTSASKRPFPLAEPFLGRCSPSHQRLSDDHQWEEYKGLLEQWVKIPKHDGVLSISDYGCAICAVLILNGPYCGQVWGLTGDAAYYGPFGGFEIFHDESTSMDWSPTSSPQEYSFFEWYENWLDGRLKVAGLFTC